MKLHSKCLPTGALAYDSVEPAVRMVAKLFEKSPYLPFFPNIDSEDSVLKRTLSNIPGVKVAGKRVKISAWSEELKLDIDNLEKVCNNPKLELLEPYALESVFMTKFESLIRKFKPNEAYVNILGPFTLSQTLSNAAEDPIILDKNYRKLFILAICSKALWIINKIKEISDTTTPVIVLEEHNLAELGNLKRDNEEITIDLVTNLLSRVIEKIHNAGAIVAVQCYEKCDWKIPINAGVDIISFDAYNNPNNICIIPEHITEFIEKGGKINWAIIPTKNETLVKSLNIDTIEKRFLNTAEGLILAGVPRHLVYDSALVSILGDADKLPIIHAEKALILSIQLAKKIAALKKNNLQ